MKASSLSFSAVAGAVLTAAIVAVSMAAQAPQPQQAPAGEGSAAQQAGPPPGGSSQAGPGGGQHREFPAPTNLKVLPKTLTGKQVRDVMEGWSGQLGVHCDTCHTKEPGKVGPNGWPVLNFPDDSKKEKETARLMFKMTADINDNYVSMVDMDHDEHADEDHAAHKVTCGTCHRGHQKPEAYVPPKEHDGPPHLPAASQKPPIPR